MLKDFPIEIDVDDNKIYAQIAYLLDTTEIITEIYEVREKFKIFKPFSTGNYDKWHDHLLELAGYDIKKYKEMNKLAESIKTLNDKRWNKWHKWLKSTEHNLIKWASLYGEFTNLVAKIRNLYHYPPIFDDVITQAILFNRILSFKSAFARLFYERGIPYKAFDQYRPNDPELHIIVTPYSTKKDVLEALEDCKGYLKDEAQLTHFFEPRLDADTRNRIKDFRKWYWLNYKTNPDRLGYRKIATQTGIKMETVKSGIRAYAKFISTKP